MSIGPEREIIGYGGNDREPVTDVAWRWLRAHPGALAVLAVTTTALAAGAVVVWGVPAVRGPNPPALSVTLAHDPSSSPPRWEAAADGRPTGPLGLTFEAQLRRAPSDTVVTVLGLAGPGLTMTDPRPVTVPTDGSPVGVALATRIACDAMPSTLSRGAYGLRVRVSRGTRARTTVVSAGPLGDEWTHLVATACATWLAQRNATVTALTARVHPTLPRVDLTMTVDNAGTHPLRIETVADRPTQLRLTGLTPAALPARSSTTVTATVVAENCDDASQLGNVQAPFALTDAIDLLGVTSDLTPPALPAGTTSGDPRNLTLLGSGRVRGRVDLGTQRLLSVMPSGLVLDAGPRRTLVAALHQACGDIESVSASALQDARYDATRRELEFRTSISLTAGRARTVSLQLDGPWVVKLDSSGLDKAPQVPTTRTLQGLVPDGNGQVRATLRYRIPPKSSCDDGSEMVYPIRVTVQTPGAGGMRTVSFLVSTNSPTNTTPFRQICSGG